ncbi:hypothetical protein BKA70DRAFT_1428562 [Coprinopsis sp. MPI-PUGE-AT-0042]|nr:hypothetical protein BKA70DRAFT_1428562 [Coprinopsis sp. MPI-PUGE-AT-0042]
MGRPRLYHTAEEKLAANRLKSKKHHEKNKKTINKKKRRAYQKLHKKPACITQAKQSTASPEATVATWMARVRQVPLRIGRLLGTQSDLAFMNTVVEDFQHRLLSEGAQSAREALAKHTQPFSSLKISLTAYCDQILPLAGVQSEWAEANAVASSVAKYIGWLDDIEMHAIEDPNDVFLMFSRGQLLYQVQAE